MAVPGALLYLSPNGLAENRTMIQAFGKALAACLVVLLVATPAIAADKPAPQYVNAVVQLHAGAHGPVIATILPATPVIVRATKGQRVKVEVTGWSPMGGARYLFMAISQRIRRAVLTDAGLPKRTVIGTGEDAWESTWQHARITGWIDKADLVPDVGTVWKEASKLYFSHCSRCHSLRKPREFTANQWPSVLKIMTARAGFSKDQAALVTALLQHHARDQKTEDSFSKEAATKKAAPPPVTVPKIVGTPKLAAKGAALFKKDNCIACHGKGAKAPIMPQYPKLAGQNAEYLLKQILDFKKGRRTNDAYSAMTNAVTSLPEDDAKALAYWLSVQ